MAEKPLRIAIVGAGTLLGKTLNDELALSSFAGADLHLIDEDDALGKLAATSDEVTFIQRIEPDSFEGADFTFFAGRPELTRAHWRQAMQAGSRIVDLSAELAGQPDVLVRAPWVQEERAQSTISQASAPDLHTRVVVPAHPVAVLLALLSGRARQFAPLRMLWATLLQPASEYGHAALEELHRQTTNLLSFQPLPTEVFGGQTAFSLAISFGADSRASLADSAENIRRQYGEIAADSTRLALQLVQVPVFHGYALSVALELEQPATVEALSGALAGPHIHLVAEASEFPGNVQAVEEDDIQVLVQPVFEAPGSSAASRYWLWIVADNLKLAAQNAIACAAELNRLRPRGSVQ